MGNLFGAGNIVSDLVKPVMTQQKGVTQSNPEQYQQKLAANTEKETPRSGALTAKTKQQRVELSGRVGTTPV